MLYPSLRLIDASTQSVSAAGILITSRRPEPDDGGLLHLKHPLFWSLTLCAHAKFHTL